MSINVDTFLYDATTCNSSGSIVDKTTIKNELPNTPISASVSASLTPRQRQLAGLVMFKKGCKGGPGRPSISIKAELKKALTKEDALKIVNNLISGSIAGDDKKQERLLRLIGDLDNTPIVEITNNNMTVDSNLMSVVRAYLGNSPINNENNAIIDAQEIKQIE